MWLKLTNYDTEEQELINLNNVIYITRSSNAHNKEYTNIAFIGKDHTYVKEDLKEIENLIREGDK